MSSSQVLFPESYRDKTFLLSGAAGFISGHVAQFYLLKGAKVIGLDNFVTGTYRNIEYLKKNSNFTFREWNIIDGLPDFSNQKIDYILNFASPASPVDFHKIPLEIMRVNSEGTLHLLNLSKEKRARFLLASTSEVYGDPEQHPQNESYQGCVNVLGPRACYDEAKRFAEALTMVFHRQYELKTRIIRIFNTYGPGMRVDDGRVIPNFINRALSGEDLMVYGDGLQTRSFCYITDLLWAIHYVLFCDDPTPFNVGSSDEYTILDCARLVIETLKASSRIVHCGPPRDDPKQRRPDLTKLKSLFDYHPKISFREGITRTAKFFQKIQLC